MTREIAQTREIRRQLAAEGCVVGAVMVCPTFLFWSADGGGALVPTAATSWVMCMDPTNDNDPKFDLWTSLYRQMPRDDDDAT